MDESEKYCKLQEKNCWMGKSNFLIPYNKIEKTERFAIAQMNEEKKTRLGPCIKWAEAVY